MNRPTGFLTVAALLPLLAAACGDSHEIQAEAGGGAVMRVSTVAASVVPLAERLEAGGVVSAGMSATLASRIVAPIADVRVRAGDRVKSGDVLVVLDDRDVAAGARGAEASVSAAEHALAGATAAQAAAAADYRLAAAWHARIAALHERRSATTQELDEAEARLSGARARAAGADAGVQQANAQLLAARARSDAASATHTFATVRAPFDGLVTERIADPGNLASPGTPLLRIDSAGAPHVDVRVDEARGRYVRVGDRVEVLFEDEAGRGAADEPATGVVTEIARAVDADTRAFTVKVALPQGAAPRTGTFARVRFRGASREALVVPAAAVRRQGQLATVFVIEEGIARLRLLQTGYEGPEGVEVLAGVAAGEAVVTAPPPELADGRRVQPSGGIGARQ